MSSESAHKRILKIPFKFYIAAGIAAVLISAYFIIPFKDIIETKINYALKKHNGLLKNTAISPDFTGLGLNFTEVQLIFDKLNFDFTAEKTQLKMSDVFSAENRKLDISINNAVIKEKFGVIKIERGKINYNLKSGRINMILNNIEFSEHTGWTQLSAIYMFGKTTPAFTQTEALAHIAFDREKQSLNILRLNTSGGLNMRLNGILEPNKYKISADLKIENNLLIEHSQYFKQLSLYHKKLDFYKQLYLIIDTTDIKDLRKMILKN